jgi:hypothetical protein
MVLVIGVGVDFLLVQVLVSLIEYQMIVGLFGVVQMKLSVQQLQSILHYHKQESKLMDLLMHGELKTVMQTYLRHSQALMILK